MNKTDYSISKFNIRESVNMQTVYGSWMSSMTMTQPPHTILKWEMEHVIVRQPCPFCIGSSILQSELKNVNGAQLIWVYYICHDCGERYTSTEIDEMNCIPLIEKRRKVKVIITTIKEIFHIKLTA